MLPRSVLQDWTSVDLRPPLNMDPLGAEQLCEMLDFSRLDIGLRQSESQASRLLIWHKEPGVSELLAVLMNFAGGFDSPGDNIERKDGRRRMFNMSRLRIGLEPSDTAGRYLVTHEDRWLGRALVWILNTTSQFCPDVPAGPLLEIRGPREKGGLGVDVDDGDESDDDGDDDDDDNNHQLEPEKEKRPVVSGAGNVVVLPVPEGEKQSDVSDAGALNSEEFQFVAPQLLAEHPQVAESESGRSEQSASLMSISSRSGTSGEDAGLLDSDEAAGHDDGQVGRHFDQDDPTLSGALSLSPSLGSSSGLEESRSCVAGGSGQDTRPGTVIENTGSTESAGTAGSSPLVAGSEVDYLLSYEDAGEESDVEARRVSYVLSENQHRVHRVHGDDSTDDSPDDLGDAPENKETDQNQMD